MVEPAYLVLAGGLDRLYAGKWTGSNRRHREQDASYLIKLLEEAGYAIELTDEADLLAHLYDGTTDG